jgi:segregation and condensation protein A
VTVMPGDEYKVSLEVFEGPLDLLLYLIKKDELDIFNIPIEHVTKQYLGYVDMMKMLDLNIAGEFLVMAATLMMIKSRMLLPVDDRPELDDEEDDPRWELVRQLVEYKKFKDAAEHLDDLQMQQENIFGRGGDGVDLGQDGSVSLHDVSIFDLITAFQEALKKAKKEEDLTEIFADKWTVADKVDQIMRLIRTQGGARMMALFEGMTHRYEMVCTFLAILELMKLRHIRAVQRETFGDIEIVAAEG